MLIASAAIFLAIPDPLAVVVAAIVGGVAVAAGETGPFVSIEQAALPSCCQERYRNQLFSMYNVAGYAGASSGALLAGLPQFFESALGMIRAYAPLFLIYALTGLLSVVSYSRLSNKIEVRPGPSSASGKIARNSRSLIAKLSVLFALDSFGGGFIAQSFLSYWFYLRFGASLTQLGVIFFGTQLVTAISFIAAAKIAARIGLLNTMVFTHLPSNLLLITLAFAPSLEWAALLLLSRHSLSQMDVPTRQSYVVAVVAEPERAVAAGMTNTSRTLAQSFGPSIAGFLIQYAAMGFPLILGGGVKVVYDLLLYFNFRRIKPPEEIAGRLGSFN